MSVARQDVWKSRNWLESQTQRCLQLQIECRIRCYLTSWRIAFPVSPFWRVYWNPEPGARLRFEGQDIPLLPDRLILVAPQTHFTAELGDPRWHGYVHCRCGRPFDALGPMVLSHHLRGVELTYVQELFAQEGLQAPQLIDHLRLATVMGSALLQMPADRWPQPACDPRIAAVCAALDADPGANWSNAALAELAGLSVKGFIRRFGQVLGQSPKRYLRERRIDLARILLEHETASIDAIAEHCGYADRWHFSQVFKASTGLPPATWRRRVRGQ